MIRPAKLWCDAETITQCDQITQRVGGHEKVIEKIGNSIAGGFTASKILWMKENEPENYRRLAMVLLPHDYINYWLIGEKKSEYGDASGTAYFDVKNRIWSSDVLQAIDDSGKLENCLPELVESRFAIGTLLSEIAENFQLSSDVIVSSGRGDNMMGAIGTGNVSPGVVTTSLGTSGTIYSCADSPIIDQAGKLSAFCSSSDHWLPLVCTMNVTVSTELTRSVLDLNVDELNTKAAASPVGSEGIILLPYFNGERTPALPKASASIFGINGVNYTQNNLCRASIEGATLGLRYGLDLLCKHGIQSQEIRLVGGGAKSPLWRQMVADIFETPVVSPESSEAGALGAALQAMWCFLNKQESVVSLREITDEFIALDESTRAEPLPANIVQYREIYQKYLKYNELLVGKYG
ncbi:MAG: xylulokinase [Proteobacteria bacterium]|nr:xylulokinase [Pseudomonadota bacterium]